MTDEFIERLADVEPPLSEQQVANLRALLGDGSPAPEALAGLHRLLSQYDEPPPAST